VVRNILYRAGVFANGAERTPHLSARLGEIVMPIGRFAVFRRGVLFALPLGMLAFALPAAAQAPQTVRIRASIEAVDGDVLSLATRAGEKVTLTMTPDARILAIVPIALDRIKSGSYVGSAAMGQPDGTLRALEVHVFPENMRGTGDGHRPFDLQPGSTMTNGAVGEVTVATGRTLKVTYGGGEKTIVVPPDTPVVTYEPGSRALLVKGAHLIATATQAADGKLTADRISVGKDGLMPPM
jgi:hypothetical protein